MPWRLASWALSWFPRHERVLGFGQLGVARGLVGRQACVQRLRWSAAQPYLAEQHLCLQLALSLLVHACTHSPIYPHTHSLVWPHLIGRSYYSMFRAAAAVRWFRGQQQQQGVEV
jgi:hypothetical protein